jgi:ribosomal protein S6--L-glutamate ligase
VVALQALIVIGRSYDANNKQLRFACRKLVGKTFLARIMNMSASVSNKGSRFWLGYREVKDIDLCFFRSFGAGSYEQVVRRFGLMQHMESTGTVVINPVKALMKTRDKYSTITTLANAKLRVPETYVTESAHWAYRKMQKYRQIVVKPLIGSLGFGAMKFEDVDLAFNAYKRLETLGLPIYVQEYLENPQRDIRAFVVDKKIIGAIYRVAKKGNWKANIALGNKPKPLQLSGELEDLPIKAVKTLGLIYAGVDILETRDGPVLLEVNGSPSWQGLRKASGVNVAELLVKYAVGLVKR